MSVAAPVLGPVVLPAIWPHSSIKGTVRKDTASDLNMYLYFYDYNVNFSIFIIIFYYKRPYW